MGALSNTLGGMTGKTSIGPTGFRAAYLAVRSVNIMPLAISNLSSGGWGNG